MSVLLNSIQKLLTAKWGSGSDEYDSIRIDASTNTLQTIDYAHHEIHAGSHFYIAGTQDIAAGNNLDFLFITPNTTKWPHTLWTMDSEVEMLFSLYEGVVTSANGSAVTIFNNNRNSATTATVTGYSGPTLNSGSLGDGSDGGTLVWQATIGSDKKIGGSATRDHEFIGKQNTKYWFRITNGTANAAWVNYNFSWYEHIDKH